MPGDKLEFDRKDCWSIMWSEDIPDLFAVLEKARMYIFRGLPPEEPKPSTAYLCKFDSLQVRSALLDKIMDDPENPEIEHIEDHNTKSMRDTQALLETASMEDVFQFIEDNSHPKLWRQLAEFSLRKLNFQVADKAFVRCGDYHGVQAVKRLQQLDSTDKQRAEVAAFFHNFDAAEEIYRGMNRLDLAVEMRMKLGDWFKVEKILEAGGGDDAAMSKMWNNIGEYYSNRQKWSKAVQYYTKAKNSKQLVRCFYALEDYQGLQTLLTVIPEGSLSLVDLGEKFMGVGLCTQAVGAFLKAGEVKRAVNCCVFLHQWDQAIALAEEHEFTKINVLLDKYAAHLLEKGKRLQAAELLQKSGKHGEAAKMLVGLAQQALAEGSQPLRAKKLYVLAAFQIEEMRKQTLQMGMQDAAGTKRTTQGCHAGHASWAARTRRGVCRRQGPRQRLAGSGGCAPVDARPPTIPQQAVRCRAEDRAEPPEVRGHPPGGADVRLFRAHLPLHEVLRAAVESNDEVGEPSCGGHPCGALRGHHVPGVRQEPPNRPARPLGGARP